ncbi:hypothetical protein SDJN03_23353, partial [Cucurbita argyrosperma subsp. sororia]
MKCYMVRSSILAIVKPEMNKEKEKDGVLNSWVKSRAWIMHSWSLSSSQFGFFYAKLAFGTSFSLKFSSSLSSYVLFLVIISTFFFFSTSDYVFSLSRLLVSSVGFSLCSVSGSLEDLSISAVGSGLFAVKASLLSEKLLWRLTLASKERDRSTRLSGKDEGEGAGKFCSCLSVVCFRERELEKKLCGGPDMTVDVSVRNI